MDNDLDLTPKKREIIILDTHQCQETNRVFFFLEKIPTVSKKKKNQDFPKIKERIFNEKETNLLN